MAKLSILVELSKNESLLLWPISFNLARTIFVQGRPLFHQKDVELIME